MITETRASYNGVDTRVLSVPGSGTPIVLLHGYADTADTWRGVLARLEHAGRHAYAVDLPGFGYADKRAPGPLLPQFDTFVDAMLDALGSAVLAGNSLGAATAVRAASRHSDSVKALIALDDPLSARHWLAKLARARPIPAGLWVRAGRIRMPRAPLAWTTRHAMPRLLYGPGVTADPMIIAQWSRTLSKWSDVTTLGRYAFQYAYESADGHRDVNVTCPALVVHGARDWIIPVHSSKALHQLIPGSRFVVLPRSGHCPQLDDPTEVVRLVLEFLDSVEKIH
jgi:pimeloyl-ACP methyl ester carboxylesterase